MRITVDGVEVPAAAVEFELNRLIRFYSERLRPAAIDAQRDALRRRAVDQAIGAHLLKDNAERLQIEPSAADVETRIARMATAAGGPEAFARFLAGQNLTLDRLRDGVRRDRRVDLLVEKITANVPDPTEQEISDHFAAHADEYQLSEQPGRADGAPAELSDVAERVRDFLRHVRRGECIAQFVAELRAKVEVSIVDDADA
jgi:hypothetical protein